MQWKKGFLYLLSQLMSADTWVLLGFSTMPGLLIMLPIGSCKLNIVALCDLLVALLCAALQFLPSFLFVVNCRWARHYSRWAQGIGCLSIWYILYHLAVNEASHWMLWVVPFFCSTCRLFCFIHIIEIRLHENKCHFHFNRGKITCGCNPGKLQCTFSGSVSASFSA